MPRVAPSPANDAGSLGQPHLLSSPLQRPPAASAPPVDEAQVCEKTCDDGLWLAAFLSIFEFAGLGMFCLMIQVAIKGQLDTAAFILLFFCGWSGILAIFGWLGDPGGIWAALTSLGRGKGTDAATAEAIDRLRQKPPQLRLTGVASHTETRGSGKDARTTTKTTYSNTWYFEYDRWRDVSGKIAGLEKYDLALVEVVAEVVPADPETTQAIKECKDSIVKHIEANHRDASMVCRQSVVVICGDSTVDGSRIMMTRSPKKGIPCWMRKSVYSISCLCCLSTIFRLLFVASTTRVVYHLRKEVAQVTAASAVCTGAEKC